MPSPGEHEKPGGSWRPQWTPAKAKVINGELCRYLPEVLPDLRGGNEQRAAAAQSPGHAPIFYALLGPRSRMGKGQPVGGGGAARVILHI